MKVNNQLSIALTALTLGIGTSFTQPALAATLYSVLELGSTSEIDVYSSKLNDLGQVTGVVRDSDSTSESNIINGVFRTAPNSPINLTTDLISNPFNYISPNDINNSGQVVGSGGGSRLGYGIRTDADGLLVDSLFPIVSASGINDSGQIAGTGISGGIEYQEEYNAVRIDNSNSATEQTIYLGTLGGKNSYGSEINDLGQVVGGSNTTDGQFHAFRTAPNSVIDSATDDLGTLGGTFSSAADINNLGQVVGYSTTVSGEYHAFLTAANSDINSETDDLGTLGGTFSSAVAINELGQVVGSSELANGDRHAFLYDEDTMFDLNDLIADDGDFILTSATGINEQGQIAVSGYSEGGSGSYRAFLLTPVPEPTTMFGILAFGVGSGIWRKRTKQKIKA